MKAKLLPVLAVLALVLAASFGLRAFIDSQRPSLDSGAPSVESQQPLGAPMESEALDPTKPNSDIAHSAQMLVATMYAFEPATDKSPQDAMKRASDFMTGDLLRAANLDRTDVKLSATWSGWQRSGDSVTVAVETQDVQLTSQNEGTVTVWARQTVNAAIPLAPFVVEVHLVQDNGVWLADKYTLVSGAPTV